MVMAAATLVVMVCIEPWAESAAGKEALAS